VLLPGAVLGTVLATLWFTSISIAAWRRNPTDPARDRTGALFADLHRQWAADRLGEPVPARPYQPTPDAG
jgi:hypothetical protein